MGALIAVESLALTRAEYGNAAGLRYGGLVRCKGLALIADVSRMAAWAQKQKPEYDSLPKALKHKL